jgi:DNA-binding SARP family transcriptional activator
MHGVPGAPVVRFAAMEFRILGPQQVFDDARPLALGGPKQRAVLAHLILRANHTVGVEQLVDDLWGDEPPDTARNTLQTYVYRLRKVLGEERLEGRDGGYVLSAAPEEVDAARFEAIVKDAKRLSASDPAAAATRFGDALALWRGAPLDDLGQEPSLRGEIARLEELRLSATEHRIGAEIASGRNSTVISELEALTARYPLRERMWANLMLALYRGGRHAEALSTYQRARDVLIEELGTEPSTELQRLHERILRRDPSLGRTEPVRQVVRPSRVDLPPGTEFAGAPGYTALLAMRPDGSDAQELFPDLRIGEVVAIDWSPDGRWVVAAGVHDQDAVGGGTPGVLLIRADGSQMFKIAADGSEPSWRPDIS